MVFAGPVELYQVAVYQPSQGAGLASRTGTLAALRGSPSPATSPGTSAPASSKATSPPTARRRATLRCSSPGISPRGTEINIVSSALCNGSTASSDCGWSSGLAIHGFKGDAAGSKIFATKFRMPLGSKTPAYWILPSQVIRSSQYGCNCRGQGSDPTYKGGCGELDVAEILGGVTTSREATTTVYSFQDITGGGSVAFNRPVDEAAVFLVIFDAPGHRIALRRLEPNAFDFAAPLSAATVQSYLTRAGTERALK